MAGVHECRICTNTYDECDRKPRVLQCGHTYCQPCLRDVVSQASPACPSCRRDIACLVADLPINFMLLPASGSREPKEAKKDFLCSIHQNELDFWCRKCSVLMCKLCLVDDHESHELTVTEKIFSNEQILREVDGLVDENLEKTQRLLNSVRKIKQLQNCVDHAEIALLGQFISLTAGSFILKNSALGLSLDQKSQVLNVLRHQIILDGDCELGLRISTDKIYHWISQYQTPNSPEESPVQAQAEDYMPHGQTWEVITREAAERALRTMKETDHRTPKAIVRSTDESPILCLFELLQYLAVSSETMELELMGTVKKCPDENEWIPLKTGGGMSTDEWHSYRLGALARAWKDLPTASPVRSAGPAKVVALINCWTEAHDVGVLAVNKVAKKDDGSWYLPLEVHLTGYYSGFLQWLQRYLERLYSSVDPSAGECRVYVSEEIGRFGVVDLFPVLAELGKKYSTQHRLYINRSVQTEYDTCYCRWSAKHKIPVEWKDF